jgi:alpha-glucuronidase
VPNIPISDSTGVEVDVSIDDSSPLAAAGLRSLTTLTTNLRSFWPESLDNCAYDSATFGGNFKLPTISTG